MRRRRRGWVTAFLAFAFFAGLAGLTQVVHSGDKPPWVLAAQNASPVGLPKGPAPLPAVKLSAVATPVKVDDAPASPPLPASEVYIPATNTRTDMAGMVAAEDQRLRVLLHHANRIIVPGVVPIPGALPTLVLPHRPDPYTLADLQTARAVVPVSQPGGVLLVDNVLVLQGATLKLGGSGLSTMLMNSSATGFASLVTWGGTLTLAGDSAQAPLAITGWDQV